MSLKASVLAPAAALAIALASSDVHAQSAVRKGVRLTWVRGVDAEGCVGQAGLEEDLKARLRYDPFVLARELLIEGTILRAGTGFRAEFVVHDPDGKLLGARRLASPEPDCRSLGEAVAVTMTVAIDPDAGDTRGPLPEERPPAEPDVPTPLPPPVPPIAARGRAAIGGGAAVGLVPGLAASASLRVRYPLADRVDLGLGAHLWPESRQDGLGFALTSASVGACFLPWRAARFIGWCAAGHVGFFHVFVHGENLAPVEVGMFPWLAAETGPALSIRLTGPFTLDVSVAAIVPIVRRQAFVLGRPDPVWEQTRVAGAAEVGLGAVF